MPLYEFECSEGHITEILCSSRETADQVIGVADCKNCGQKVIKRRTFPTSIGISFKGSGFYKTDYSGKGEKE